jgi:ATP-dependent helicase HrpB
VPKLSVDELAPYLLWAYPGHLAKARDNHTGRYLLAAGFGAVLPQGSPLMACSWLLAIRMSDGEGEALIRWALPLDESDLAHCTPTLRTRIEWDKVNARLIAAEETCFGAIVYKQRPLKTIPPEAQAMAMRARLEHQGLPWTRNDEHLVQRCRFLHRTLPEEGWPAITDDDLIDQLVQAPSMTLRQAIQMLLSIAGHTLMDVDAQAPARLLVPSGSHLLVHYDQTTPYVEVKIQEVFGLKATPRIACAKVAIVFHLLSPAQRPVQVTSDLESFWSTGYALVRKDLRGRYPKHYWPEDPTQAIATARTVLKPPHKT